MVRLGAWCGASHGVANGTQRPRLNDGRTESLPTCGVYSWFRLGYGWDVIKGRTGVPSERNNGPVWCFRFGLPWPFAVAFECSALLVFKYTLGQLPWLRSSRLRRSTSPCPLPLTGRKVASPKFNAMSCGNNLPTMPCGRDASDTNPARWPGPCSVVYLLCRGQIVVTSKRNGSP